MKDGLRVVLGILGLTALILYILACLPSQPSWSPDGSKVLFPYYDSDTEQWGLALYDARTGTTRSIWLEKPSSGRYREEEMPSVQWTRDGTQAIVSSELRDSDNTVTLQVLVLPVGSRKPVRRFLLPKMEKDAFLSVFPEVAGHLYISSKKRLTRLNLRTGQVDVRESDCDLALAGAGDSIFYICTSGVGETEGYDFGRVNTEDLSLQPLFKVDGIKGLNGFLAPEPRGARLAVVGQGQDKDFLLLMSTGLERVLPLEVPAQQYKLGNLEWSLDGKTIFVAVLIATGEEEVTQYSIAEVPVAGGPARLVPIAKVLGSIGDGDEFFFQIALSPDGTRIAASTAHLDDDDVGAQDRALYLVNLRDPKRRVTKIPVPRAAQTAPAAAKK